MLTWFKSVSVIVGFALKTAESKSFFKIFGDVLE